MFDAVALGELLIDFAHISSNGKYPVMAANPGGAPANFLAAIQKYGGSTALIAKVGDDAFGNLLISTLSDNGIGTSGVVKDKNTFTTLAFVTFDEHNDRHFSFSRKPGADTMLDTSELNLGLIDDCKVFHFGTLSLTNEPSRSATMKAVEYAREHGKLISFDPNLRVPLWDDLGDAKKWIGWGLEKADIAKISKEEADFLLGEKSVEEQAKEIIGKYDVRLLHLTLGKDGAYYSTGKHSGFIPPYEDVIVKDTTGAGDIFGGSAMWRFLQIGKDPEELSKENLEDICWFATVAAGLSTEKSGGINSVPRLDDIISAIEKGSVA